MGNILKVTAQWSGFVGAPGYSNFYWREEDPGSSFDSGAFAAADAVNAFFTAIKTTVPNVVKWRVLTDVSIIDENSGQLVDVASAGARTDITGGVTAANYSAASGGVVTWRSAGVRNGRRVRGRTFIVPLASTMYDVDGSLTATCLSTLGTAATAYINTAGTRSPVVWARPTGPGATDGIAHNMVTSSIPDKVAILKSRRD